MSTHTPARELMHIWEIRSTLKCPVIGTCFDENENRTLLKKSGYRVKNQRFYQLHAGIMENLHSENAVSLRVDRFLRNKYRQSIAELAGLPVDDFMEIWRERLKTGQIDDIFYIAATRPDLPDHHFSEIFGEIHMLGHTNMNSLMRARQEVDKREAANRKLETLLEKEKMRSSELKQALSGSEETLRAMRTRIRQLETVLMTLRQNDTDRPALSEAGIGDLEISADLRRLEADNRNLEKESRRLEREKRKLQIEVFDLRNTNRELSDETSVLIAKLSGIGRCNGENCTAACPEYESCPRRILMVGGLTRLKALYREAVESVGSEFEYHDGYMKNGKQAIEAGIKRCDMVLCPVNCNSHGACDMVKRLCRKYDKPMRILSSSSLSAVLSVVCGENSHNVLN